ncbi:MAG: Lrp/AsnC family transcriptional regulator [Paracoccaceae bacterium]
MEKIDRFDARILRLLQTDAEMPLDEIGERVGLSRNAVWRRIKLMEASGLIRARVALLNPDRLGLGLTVFMLIRTDRHAPDWLDQFARATRDMPEILGAYRMTGDLDYLIRARVSDVKDYDRLYQALVRRVELADVSASFVMEEIKETTVLPVSG